MKRRYIVLTVDDDKYIIDIVKKLLSESIDIDVITAENIQEAKEILKNIDIDLLITDQILPDGLGIDLVHEIRKNESLKSTKYLPIIMLSGQGNDLKIPALQHGVNMFLSKPFNNKELFAITQNLLELLNAYESLDQANTIIAALTKAVETRDSYTEGHSRRVADYSLMLYDAVGYDNYQERLILETGCLLHDIGKLGTPDSILKSSKKLTDEERLEIQKHPIHGYDICKELKNLEQSLTIIRSHHEKLNGEGYPDNLKEDDIDILVQIVAIADIYDALTSKRAYRTENSNEKAFEIMDEMVKNNEINSYLYEMFKSLIK